jgi:hypothetical protein
VPIQREANSRFIRPRVAASNRRSAHGIPLLIKKAKECRNKKKAIPKAAFRWYYPDRAEKMFPDDYGNSLSTTSPTRTCDKCVEAKPGLRKSR